MSLTKRIFLENDPAYEDVRRRCGEEAWAYIRQFKFRIPTRRRNRAASYPYWSPLWRTSLQRAVKELGVESVNVNDGLFLRTEADMKAVRALAETLCGDRPQFEL
ncbi:MAG TPA: hypothetical protein VGW40_13665 [Allosphingosinicella sp.]|nr:hypothetical protein [Allosphingosinicella sp.]